MAGIFISYRRDDSSGWAGRLFRDLVERYGRDQVFMDIDTLRPGTDYVESLHEAVSTCDAVLALIGPRWTTVTDASGNRRLDNPKDLVTLEIATALVRPGTPVVPVLVGNARMPSADNLPGPLKDLARRQYFELSEGRWDFDVDTLTKRLEPVITPRQPAGTSGPQPAASGLLSPVDFRAWLEPERIEGSGRERVELVVENLGAQMAIFDIAARRKDAGLDVAVETARVEVDARARRSIGVELTPRTRDELGPPSSTSGPRALGFAVHVGPSDAPAAAFEIAGQYLLMPAAVSLRLARREMEAPGAVTFEVRIENLGMQEVAVALEAEDHAGQCAFAFDRPHLTVPKRAHAHVALTVTPPDHHAPDARWRFDVRARPTAPPGPPVQVEGALVYAPLRIAIRLPQPEVEADGPGVFHIEVENLGTREVAVSVSAADASRTCTYAFDRPRATIAPRSVAQFNLTVTPPGDHPLDARWRFDVLATPVGSGAETVRGSGVLVYRPPPVELTVTPEQARARRGAGYKVSVHNPSRTPQTIRLAAADPAGRLRLRWPEGSADVAAQLGPGQTTVVRLRASPFVRNRGTEPRTMAFSVAATPIRPPGPARSIQPVFVALPGRRWPGRYPLLIGAGVVLGLLALRGVGGIGWPEMLFAVAPMVGGIILRTLWWVLLYPLGLGLGLRATARDRIEDALTRSDNGRLVHQRLLEALREIYLRAPDEMRHRLSGHRLWCMIEMTSPTPLKRGLLPKKCVSDCLNELKRLTAPKREESLVWCVSEWNILALAALCAVIGTVVGKVLAKRIARR